MNVMQAYYDDQYRKSPSAHITPLYWSRLAAARGQRVLDFGCGSGAISLLLRKAGVEAYGVDISEVGIARGREEARRSGLDPEFLTTVRADAPLPFPDGFFDVAGSHWVVDDVPDPAAMLREQRRVTRPGGRILLYTSNRIGPFRTKSSYVPSLRKFVDFWVELLCFLSGRPIRPTWAVRKGGHLISGTTPKPFVLRDLFRKTGIEVVALRTWNMHGPRPWPKVRWSVVYALFDCLDRLPALRHMGHGIFLEGRVPGAETRKSL